MTTKATTHRFLFTLSLVELGKFKPVTLVPQDITVAVDVPMTSDYIANFLEVTIEQVTGGNTPKPILSLNGLRYVLDHSQSALDDFYMTKEDIGSVETDDADDIEIIE